MLRVPSAVSPWPAPEINHLLLGGRHSARLPTCIRRSFFSLAFEEPFDFLPIADVSSADFAARTMQSQNRIRSLNGSRRPPIHLCPLDRRTQRSVDGPTLYTSHLVSLHSRNGCHRPGLSHRVAYLYGLYLDWAQGTRRQNRVCFLKVKNSRLFVCFRFVAEGKQEGLWEGSGHSGQGAAGGHAGTRHE